MATKKRKKSRTRSKGMSEGLSRRVKRGRRSPRRRSSKGLLSEAFSPAAATQTGKGMLSGAIAGYAVASVEPMLENLPNWARHLTLLGGSFVAGTVLKMPNISVGIASAWGYGLAKDMQGGMNEDGDWADPDGLDEEPEYMDEAGNPMFLAADGNFYYLDENAMSEEEEEELSEMLAEEELYPEYVNVANY